MIELTIRLNSLKRQFIMMKMDKSNTIINSMEINIGTSGNKVTGETCRIFFVKNDGDKNFN